MKVLDFSLLLFVAVTTVWAAPTTRPGEPDECTRLCLNGVLEFGEELNLLKNPKLPKYFNKLDEVCGVISTARNCIQACGASSNPFSLESLNIVCQPESADRLGAIKQCLHYIDHNIDETCTKECAESNVIDETDVTPKMNPLWKKDNANCVAFKCMSRCTIQVVATECGKELGKELEGLLQYVLDTQHKDLTKLKLIEVMAKSTPPECNYLYDPSVLFGAEAEKKDDEPEHAHDPAEDAKDLYTQAQLQLLLKQIELTEKQEHLIERENAKLDMEMSYMQEKTHQREERIHAQQHAVPMFVPPKDAMPPMPMESMQHPSMPSEPSHPMEAGPQGAMDEPQHQPEEPQHQAMPDHPPMPMEESMPKQPHHSKGEPLPVFPIQEGMPMEHPPQPPMMEFIPIQIPMELPRFF